MKTILLAEHDTFLINVYASQFRKSGYSTTIAANGQAALLRIKDVNPDLVILDVGLPNPPTGGDGMEVLRILRHELGRNDLKVVMLSDFHQKNDNNVSVDLGILKYFSKTENTAEEIMQEIKSILS